MRNVHSASTLECSAGSGFGSLLLMMIIAGSWQTGQAPGNIRFVKDAGFFFQDEVLYLAHLEVVEIEGTIPSGWPS